MHAGFSSWCTLSHSSVVDLSLVRGKMVAERKYWREPHLHCRWKGECFGILTGIQLHTSSRQSQEDWECHNWCRTCKFTRLNSVAVMHEELKVDAAGYGVNSGKHYSHSIHNITCIMCFQSWIHNNSNNWSSCWYETKPVCENIFWLEWGRVPYNGAWSSWNCPILLQPVTLCSILLWCSSNSGVCPQPNLGRYTIINILSWSHQ